jgi:hypothetical protein
MYQFSPWKKFVMEGKVRPFLIFILLSEYSKEIIFHASAHHPFGFIFRSKLAADTLMVMGLLFLQLISRNYNYLCRTDNKIREKLKSTWVFLTSLSPEFLSVIFSGYQLWTWDPAFFSFGSFIFLFLANSLPMCYSLISCTAVKFFRAFPHLNHFPLHDLLTAPALRGCFTLQIYFSRIHNTWCT